MLEGRFNFLFENRFKPLGVNCKGKYIVPFDCETTKIYIYGDTYITAKINIYKNLYGKYNNPPYLLKKMSIRSKLENSYSLKNMILKKGDILHIDVNNNSDIMYLDMYIFYKTI